VDVRLKTRSGKIIHVEIQRDNFPEMRKRIVFSDAKMITGQIRKGNDYKVIKRVISIIITDHPLISESPHYHHRFTFYDPETAVEFTDLIEIHTLEIPKLPENPDI
jgi:predicted transposase/invertase (TIGR01784 family)